MLHVSNGLVFRIMRVMYTSCHLPSMIVRIEFSDQQTEMNNKHPRHSPLPLAMLLDRQSITEVFPSLIRLVRWPFRWRDLPQQLSELEPRTLLGSQESYSRLFRNVAHEHRHKQGQDEDGAEQVEYDEEDRIALRPKRLGLESLSCCVHGGEHDVDPPFLGDDLEKDEHGVSKVVKVVVGVGDLPWGEYWPVIVERSTVPFPYAIR